MSFLHHPSEIPFRGGEFPGWKTVEEGREVLRDVLRRALSKPSIEKHCMCCGQVVKLYRRPVNRTMAKALLRMVEAGGAHDFVHAPSLRGDTHEVSQLSWWGLVIPDTRKREDGGKRGRWMVTPKGLAWAQGRITIPKYARTFNAHCFLLEGDPTHIDEVLPFNFRELMDGGDGEPPDDWPDDDGPGTGPRPVAPPPKPTPMPPAQADFDFDFFSSYEDA